MLKINLFIVSLLIISLIFISCKKANSYQEYNLCLKPSYELYKQNFMSKDGRIIDPDKNNITTSEGQSYIMLRSLAIGDKKTFDLSYKWAKNNLQRKDKLFSWIWGENKNGKYEILDPNTASDADVDIAFSLILAYEKWKQYTYLLEAEAIINSIWNNETRRIGENIVLAPGVVQNADEKIEINPSYFSPYAFRLFQKYDDIHDWNCLIDSSYYYLSEVMTQTKTKLPPNWFLIQNDQIVLEDSERSDFSYDAIRVFARIYLDYIETGENRALPILEKTKFFITAWNNPNSFFTNYKANGELRDQVQFAGAIAIITPIIRMYDPEFARKIYVKKLDPIFSDEKYWKTKKGYYEKNLSWFGCYLYNIKNKTHKDRY